MKKIVYVSLLCLILIGGTACSSKESESPVSKKAKMVEVSKESSTTQSTSDLEYPYTFEDVIEKPKNPNLTKVVNAFIDNNLPMFIDEGFGPKSWPSPENDTLGMEYITFYVEEPQENRPSPEVISVSVYPNKENYDVAIDMVNNPGEYNMPAPSKKGFTALNESVLSIMSANYEFDSVVWEKYEQVFLDIK